MAALVRGVLLCALLAVGGIACSESPPRPTPTGSICPPDSTLTWENFGEPFMDAYCTRCHSSELHGAARMGASLYHDFDSLYGVVVVGDHVDERAAAGPDSVNELMPPDGDTPTLEERYQLGEWVACEIERINERPDAGPADAGPADAGPADTGSADAGRADAGP